MKKLLLTALFMSASWAGMAQAPSISGDTMLCPESNGTAYVANDMNYDSYQWYVDFYPHDTFEAVEGATEESFTYDAYNYSLAKIKVVATVNGTSYNSNELLIDSMVFTPISYMTEFVGNAYFDPNQQAYVLCEGGAIINTVNNPYNHVQWYSNEQPISGATNQQFTITVPGTYYAVASPSACEDFEQTTLTITVVSCPQQNQAPVIAGDIMMCPNTTGTAGVINNMAYASYQWFVKFYGSEEFVPIANADTPTITYDWYNYDQSQIKLVVETAGGETFESNVLQIDSYNWGSMFISGEVTEYLEWDPDNQRCLLCEGAEFVQTLLSPYTANIQWYKDGVAIEGATEATYTITSEGSYTVIASPEICQGPENSAESLPIVVVMQECELGTGNNTANLSFTLYPNPASDFINIILPDSLHDAAYRIVDVTGKTILTGNITSKQPTINVMPLEKGTYILSIEGTDGSLSKLFIKQ